MRLGVQPLMQPDGVLTPAGEASFARLFALMDEVFGHDAVARRDDLMQDPRTAAALADVGHDADVLDLLDEMIASPEFRQ